MAAEPSPPSPLAAAAASRGGPIIVPYAQLQEPPYPGGVDTGSRELHFSDDEFFNLFEMTKDAFAALPGWRRQNIKKKLNLF